MAYIVNDPIRFVSKKGECLNVKRKKNAVSPAMIFAGLTVLFLLLLSVKKDLQASEISFGDVIKQSVAQEFGESLIQKFVPVFSFVQQSEQEESWILERQIAGMIPIYGYYRETKTGDLTGEEMENSVSLEDIILAEAQETEGSTEDVDVIPEEQQNETKSDTGQQTQSGETIQELLLAENEAAMNESEEVNLALKEESEQIAEVPQFIPHQIQSEIDLQAFSDYEALVNNFYTIDSNTMAGSDQLEISKLTGKDLRISKEGEGPQILIYHTHSQEAFADSIPGDVSTTIVGVGAHLSKILEEDYGYRVLHHTGEYDVETRDDAYSNSLPAIEQLLAENPSIEVIIDLHRDSMPEGTKLVMDLDGRPTARFMFFNGLSRTQKTGNIAYLYNENLDDNLAFSFQLQLKATEYYPGLARKIYLKGYRYNMHLRPRTTLIELGAQNNTVEEVMNACDPLAHILDMVLSGGA